MQDKEKRITNCKTGIECIRSVSKLVDKEFSSNIAAVKNRNLKTALHIKSESETDAAGAGLFFIAGKKHCCFAVISHLNKEITAYGFFTADEEPDYERFFDEHEIFKKRFHLSAVAFDTTETVLIPLQYYKMEEIPLHLDATSGKAAHAAIVSEQLTDWQMHTVYRLPSALQSAVARKFQQGYSWHINTVMLKNHRANSEQEILVDFKTDEFSVLAFAHNNLLLAQTFHYSAPEDVLYYLLKCCQQLGLSQQAAKLTLSGLIEKDSAVYRELYKYFIHLEFDGLHGGVKISEALQIHPEHYYSTISKLAACVL